MSEAEKCRSYELIMTFRIFIPTDVGVLAQYTEVGTRFDLPCGIRKSPFASHAPAMARFGQDQPGFRENYFCCVAAQLQLSPFAVPWHTTALPQNSNPMPIFCTKAQREQTSSSKTRRTTTHDTTRTTASSSFIPGWAPVIKTVPHRPSPPRLHTRTTHGRFTSCRHRCRPSLARRSTFSS